VRCVYLFLPSLTGAHRQPTPTLTCHPANDHPVNPSPNLLWSTRGDAYSPSPPPQVYRVTYSIHAIYMQRIYRAYTVTILYGQLNEKHCILVYDCMCVYVYMDIILTTTPISVSSESVHTQYDLWRRRKQTIQRGQS